MVILLTAQLQRVQHPKVREKVLPAYVHFPQPIPYLRPLSATPQRAESSGNKCDRHGYEDEVGHHHLLDVKPPGHADMIVG